MKRLIYLFILLISHSFSSIYCMKPENRTVNFIQDEKPLRCEQLIQTPNPAQVNALEFSPDGKYLLFSSLDGSIEIWDTDENRELLKLREKKTSINKDFPRLDHRYVMCVAMIPETTLVAVSIFSYQKENIIIWDYTTGKLHHTFSTEFNVPFMNVTDKTLEAFSITANATGKTIENIFVHTFDLISGKEIIESRHQLEGEKFKLAQETINSTSLERCALSTNICIAPYKVDRWDFGSVGIFDRRSRKLIQHLFKIKDIPNFKLVKLAMSNDGSKVAAAGTNGSVLFWRNT